MKKKDISPSQSLAEDLDEDWMAALIRKRVEEADAADESDWIPHDRVVELLDRWVLEAESRIVAYDRKELPSISSGEVMAEARRVCGTKR